MGNAGRTYNDVRRDGYRNLNISLARNFPIRDVAPGVPKITSLTEELRSGNWARSRSRIGKLRASEIFQIPVAVAAERRCTVRPALPMRYSGGLMNAAV